jgi:hypothetical protein
MIEKSDTKERTYYIIIGRQTVGVNGFFSTKPSNKEPFKNDLSKSLLRANF